MFTKGPFEDPKNSNNQKNQKKSNRQDPPSPFVIACKEFDLKYKDNAACVEELVRILGENYLYCRKCNSKEVSRSYGSRTLVCFDCRRGSSVFTDTVYDGIKRPRAHLLGHYLIGRGIEFNSHQFHYAARTAYSTALAITKKLAAIINTDMQKEVGTIHSGAFLAVFKRRSSETPARKHPRCEQEEMEKNNPEEDDMDFEEYADFKEYAGFDESQKKPKTIEDLGEREKALFEMLSDEKKHFDELLYPLGCSIGDLCLSIFNLEMIGLIERHGGDYYTLKKKEAPPTVLKSKSGESPLVRDFIDFINTSFQGISRKCLHLYLALFWSRVSRKRWNLNALAKACREHPPIKGKDVLTFICPLAVNIVGAINF